MFGFRTTEILLVVVAVLILFFGARKILELVKNIAEAVRNLRGAFKDIDGEDMHKDNK